MGEEERPVLFPGGPTPDYIDSTFRPLIIRALRYYRRMLNDLTTLNEGEKSYHEMDPFGAFIVARVTDIDQVTQELIDNPHQLSEIIREEKYKSTVYQAQS